MSPPPSLQVPALQQALPMQHLENGIPMDMDVDDTHEVKLGCSTRRRRKTLYLRGGVLKIYRLTSDKLQDSQDTNLPFLLVHANSPSVLFSSINSRVHNL